MLKSSLWLQSVKDVSSVMLLCPVEFESLHDIPANIVPGLI